MKVTCFPQRGFTLIEMLVVVMLMGVLIGLVSITVRPDERGMLRVEAERLAQLLSLAAEEARLTGKSVRWSATDKTYRFLRPRQDGEWREIRDNDILRPRELANGVTITALTVDARPRAVRQIDFVPHGSAQSFRIDLALGDERSAVTSSPIGEIRVAPRPGEFDAVVQ